MHFVSSLYFHTQLIERCGGELLSCKSFGPTVSNIQYSLEISDDTLEELDLSSLTENQTLIEIRLSPNSPNKAKTFTSNVRIL